MHGTMLKGKHLHLLLEGQFNLALTGNFGRGLGRQHWVDTHKLLILLASSG